MCGIAGIFDPKEPVDPRVLEDMCDLLEHRGPDDRGIFVDRGIGLSMRRLSIIDVTTGHQPIFNEDKTLSIVFNGEIYNYLELRRELEDAGHRFITNTDTETIIHLYEECREQCVEQLRGMFAFAIWDAKERSLFIARDRFGIKPLYFWRDGDTLVFASEIKSIFAFPRVPHELDLGAVQEFFTFLYVPHSRTLFKNIRKLLPGHFMKAKDGELTFHRYYQFPEPKDTTFSCEADAINAFFEVSLDTVRRHMISDVPLGAFLSGGIDSSLVVGLMSQLVDRPVNTFSIGYDEGSSSFDERRYAAQAADIFGTNHRELVVTPEIAKECLPVILGKLDEPFGDASVIPNYLLSEFARKYVKVALSGLGGDEICGGYERYLGTILAEQYKPLLSSLAYVFRGPITKWMPDSATGNHFPERLKRFASYASLPLKERYYHFIAKFNVMESRRLFKRDVFSSSDNGSGKRVYDSYWETDDLVTGLRKLSKMDFDTYLVDDLLALSDRTSMLHSLEMRVPLVDHVMVEFFWQLPDNLKIKRFSKKYLLKKAAEKLLPRDLIYRKKKGFSVPLTLWFRDALRPYVEDVLASENLNHLDFFDPSYIREILQEHISGKRNHDEKIFALLSFSEWHRKNFS